MPRGLGYIQQTVMNTVKEQQNGKGRMKRIAGIVKGKLYPDLWNYDSVTNKANARKSRYQYHTGIGYGIWENQQWQKVSNQDVYKRQSDFTKARVTVHNAIKALIKRGYLFKDGEYISCS